MSNTSGANPSRRRFLKWGALGLAGSALVLGGGVFALVRPGATSAGRKALSDDEARFVDAAAEAYFPPGNSLGLDARALDVGGAMDDIIAGFPSLQQTAIRGLFNVFDQWPRLSLSGAGKFADAPLTTRIALLKAFDDSSTLARRGLGEVLRAVLGLAVFARPEALAAVGHGQGCPGVG